MICCRCLAARDGTGFEPSAAITVYKGDALCREHWIVAWEHDVLGKADRAFLNMDTRDR